MKRITMDMPDDAAFCLALYGLAAGMTVQEVLLTSFYCVVQDAAAVTGSEASKETLDAVASRLKSAAVALELEHAASREARA